MPNMVHAKYNTFTVYLACTIQKNALYMCTTKRFFLLWINHNLVVLIFQYVGYARKYVHPKIGPDAAKVLQVIIIYLLWKNGDSLHIYWYMYVL